MSEIKSLTISVVIPVYNRGKTIRACLDSVLAQTFSPFEVIVVDDCSTDDTAEIVNTNKDPRLKCITLERNSGAQVARNCGIREAKGQWIAFQDSDDEWHLNKLEKQVEALAKVNFDLMTLIHTDAFRLDHATNNKTLWKLPFVDGETAYSKLLSAPGPLFQTMFVSKLALEKIDYLDEDVPSYQEWDTSIRLSKHCRFIHLQEPLFIYHLHEGDTISKNRKRAIDGYKYIIDKFEDEIREVCGEKVWENHLYNQLIRCLTFKLWKEADVYFELFLKKGDRFKLLRLCRYFHWRPHTLLKIKGLFPF